MVWVRILAAATLNIFLGCHVPERRGWLAIILREVQFLYSPFFFWHEMSLSFWHERRLVVSVPGKHVPLWGSRFESSSCLFLKGNHDWFNYQLWFPFFVKSSISSCVLCVGQSIKVLPCENKETNWINWFLIWRTNFLKLFTYKTRIKLKKLRMLVTLHHCQLRQQQWQQKI